MSARPPGGPTGAVPEDWLVLVAVEPVVLEGALAALIERAEHAEVVQFHRSADALSQRYDAAVVSSPAPQDVHAGVLVCLPADGIGDARVTQDGKTVWASVASHHEIIRLLSRHGRREES